MSEITISEPAVEGNIVDNSQMRVEPDYWSTRSDIPSGYTRIADVEWDGESYEFHMTRVYIQDASGELFYATDSGCSCPVPFEETTVGDLEPIKRMQDWYDHVTSMTRAEGTNGKWDSGTPTSAIDEAECARRIIAAELAGKSRVQGKTDEEATA